MNILSIQGFNNNSFSNLTLQRKKSQIESNQYQILDKLEMQPSQDVFVKNSNALNNVSFTGKVPYLTFEFENRFPRNFFKKILRERVHDAYSDIVLIPLEEIDNLKAMGVLNQKSEIAMKHLKKYRNQLFSIEKEVYSILETLSKKHPDLTLQELLRLKYAKSEKSLITQQSKILNKMNMVINKLPESEYNDVSELLQESYEKIICPHSRPEEQFFRKRFLKQLKRINISDKELRERLITIAESLPSSATSVDAFVVKYSKPYKLKYLAATSSFKRVPRTSEDLAVRLLEPSSGSDDHIYPQVEFRKMEARHQRTFRLTMLTSKKTNNEKTDIPIDVYIKTQNPLAPSYIQHHVNDLINVSLRWFKRGRVEDSAQLSDYILELRKELNKRSKLVNVDLGDFEDYITVINKKAETIAEKSKIKANTKAKSKGTEKVKAKRAKKAGRADNNHKEHHVTSKGKELKNRKVQRHTPRF